MKAILYIGHGTRFKRGGEEATSFVKRVMDRIDVPIQEVSFLELTEPSIEQGFQRCIERGATEVTVVPLFLLAASHIKKDIPRILTTLKLKYPHVQIKVRDPFGVQDGILDAMAELVKETVGKINKDDSVLIVGRGSSDAAIQVAFTEIAAGIAKRLGIETVSVCYLASTEPKLQEGLDTVSRRGKNRVIVVPYLLFSGLLLTEIKQNVQKRQRLGQNIVQTAPLAGHRVIEEIVVQRAMEEDPVHRSIND